MFDWTLSSTSERSGAVRPAARLGAISPEVRSAARTSGRDAAALAADLADKTPRLSTPGHLRVGGPEGTELRPLVERPSDRRKARWRASSPPRHRGIAEAGQRLTRNVGGRWEGPMMGIGMGMSRFWAAPRWTARRMKTPAAQADHDLRPAGARPRTVRRFRCRRIVCGMRVGRHVR